MKLSRFIERLMSEVPSIGNLGSGASTTQLTALLNEGVFEVNALTKVYKGYKDIDIVAEQQIYQLSVVDTEFMGMDKPGVFFKDSNGDWCNVYPKTLTWLATRYPGFLNAESAAVPRWYWQDGDDLGFYNKPDASQTAGARIYRIKKPTNMGNDDHYPFSGSAIELVALRPLDDAILAYARWKLAPAFGKVTDVDMRRREFLDECRRGVKLIRRRPDMTIDSGYGIDL